MAHRYIMLPCGKRWQYVCLLVFLAITTVNFGYLTGEAIQSTFRPHARADYPFGFRESEPVVSWASKEAWAAGLHKGDRVLEIDGAPPTGSFSLTDAARRAGPGGTIRVVAQGDGATRTVAVPVSAWHGSTTFNTIVTLELTILTPWFCLALGFWAAFLRPWDRQAWILLFLLVSFALMAVSSDPTFFPPALRLAHVVSSWLLRSSWAIWMLLFGLYFPETIGFERSHPWIKWLLIVPIAFDAVLDVLRVWGRLASFPLAVAVVPLSDAFRLPVTFFGMAAIGLFFACNGRRLGSDTSPDTRRRVRLLYFGSMLTLTPVFVLTIIGLVLHKPPFGFAPAWVNITVLVLMTGFPIVLAYLIVVHRAMDVRVVLRQGLQYALARGGVRVLQVMVTITVIIVLVRVSNADFSVAMKVTLIVVGASCVLLMRRIADRLRQWTDRRFFRESYYAERVLSDLGQKARRMMDSGPLLETVARTLSESLHVPRVAMLMESNGGYAAAYALGFESPSAVLPPFTKDSATVRRLRERNEPLTVYFDDPRSWVNRDGELPDDERTHLESLDSQLLLPLAVQERLLGFVSLGPKQSEEPFTKADIHLLESVASQTGLALENSRLAEAISAEVAQRERVNRELEIARDVQQRLLPRKLPDVPGLEYAGVCRPAQSVGGDYYDFVSTPNGEFGIAIGDISGKGVPAALLMAVLQASLRGQVIGAPTDMAQLMVNMNRLIYDASPSNRFATFVYAQYDPGSRRLAFVNAGHNPPLLVRCGGEFERLMPSGPALGLTARACYRQQDFALEPGDVLVAFTDGISEAMNCDGEEFGEDRLSEIVKVCDGLAPREMVERILATVDIFVAGAPQHDDITLAVARVGGFGR